MRGVKSLTPLAITLVILVMAVAVGGIMLTEFKPQTYEHHQIENEVQASTGTVPETITADTVKKGLDQYSETIILQDNETSKNTTLERGTDYKVISYSSGEFNITNADPDGDGTDEITNTDDTYYLDYTYNQAGKSTNIVSQGLSALDTYGSFFTVIVVVGIGAVLLLLLQVFRSAGTSVNRTTA